MIRIICQLRILVGGSLACVFEVRVFFARPATGFQERSEGNSNILGDYFLIRIIWQLRILVRGVLAYVFEVRVIFVRPATEKLLWKDLKATVIYLGMIF